MITARAGLRVWVATRPIDFRKGVHGLVALVADGLCADPYGGDIFVFRSKRSDRIKLLAWDGSGVILATKWLEDGHFAWPPIQDGTMASSLFWMASHDVPLLGPPRLPTSCRFLVRLKGAVSSSRPDNPQGACAQARSRMAAGHRASLRGA